MKKIAVVGSGSWGTALASVSAYNGHPTTIWTRDGEVEKSINHYHQNKKYLPNHELPKNLYATTNIKDVVCGAHLIMIVVPSHAVRETMRMIKPHIKEKPFITHATKGFELETNKRMSQVISEELGRVEGEICVLSGPNHAEEIIERKIAATVVACQNMDIAKEVQIIFNNDFFRVYTNSDYVGAEVGGSVKNIIALAAGILDGLLLGDNAKAALLTRGLAEIARIGEFFGAQPMTFLGLAGVGDLIVTGTSQHSRNWKAGYAISQGKKTEQVAKEMGMVVEGFKTVQAVYNLTQQHQIDSPITEALYQVLFEEKDVKDAVRNLMLRHQKEER